MITFNFSFPAPDNAKLEQERQAQEYFTILQQAHQILVRMNQNKIIVSADDLSVTDFGDYLALTSNLLLLTRSDLEKMGGYFNMHFALLFQLLVGELTAIKYLLLDLKDKKEKEQIKEDISCFELSHRLVNKEIKLLKERKLL